MGAQRHGAAAAAGESIISLGSSHDDTDVTHAKVEVIVIDDDEVIAIDEEEEVIIVESEEASNVSIHLSSPLKLWLLQVAKEVVEELVEEEVVEQQHPVCPICLDFFSIGDEVEA